MTRFPKVTPLLGAFALALAACGTDPQSPPGEVRIALTSAPTSVYPGGSHNRYASTIVLATYETPLTYRPLGESKRLAPQLATAMPLVSDDGLVVTLKLRKDAVFTDDPAFPDGRGRPVTAHDVAYSILRHFDPALALTTTGAAQFRDHLVGIKTWQGDYAAPPEGIEVIDEHTVIFRLVAPTYEFLHTLATAKAAVVPREAEQYHGDDLARRTVGSGPYTLTQFDEARAVLERNPRYPVRRYSLVEAGYVPGQDDQRLEALEGRQLPMIPRVRLEFASDPASRWLSFQNGELDATPVGVGTLKSMLENADGLKLAPAVSDQYTLHVDPREEVILMRIRMDDDSIGHHADPVTDQENRELRCALARAVNWEELNQINFEGKARVITGVIPPALPEFEDLPNPMAFDPWMARTVFESVSARRALPELRYGYAVGGKRRQAFDKWATQLTTAGYPAEQIVLEQYASFSDFLNGAMSGNHNVTFISWTLNASTAENVLQLFFGPNAAPGANLGNYKSDHFDRLFEQLQTTSDPQARQELVDTMNRQLMSDCAFFGSLAPARLMLSRKDLLGRVGRNATLVGRYFQYLAWDTEP